MAGIAEITHDAVTFYEKGKALRASGDAGGAIAAYNQAVKLKPDFAEACLELAELMELTGPLPTAIKLYSHWLKIVQHGGSTIFKISDPVVGKKVQELLEKAGAFYHSGDMANAQAQYQEVLAICPGMPTAELGLAGWLHAHYRYEEAAAKLLGVIKQITGYGAALNMLGSCWRHMGRYAMSIAAYQQAIAADPKQDHVWANTARAYSAAKLFDQTFVTPEALARYAPEDTDAQLELSYLLANGCRWSEFGIVQSRIQAQYAKGSAYEPFKSLNIFSANAQLENARRWSGQRWPDGIGYDSGRALPADTRGNKKLRIGYLSSDFHAHATVFLMAELFELHNRSEFEIFAYSCGRNDASDGRKRIERAVDAFHDLRVASDQAIAARIRDDGIDILVDLKGYTQDNRLGVMALRPAPLQMHYLGYPGTIGAAFIDYFIGDSVASHDDAIFHERLIRLPHSYQINDRKRPLPVKTKTRAQHGLPENAFVFCNLNAPYKTTHEMFAGWMRILKAVPDSVLWLYSGQQQAIPVLRQEAESQGVDPSRLVFAGAAPLAEHLERYLHADVCLDTSPVCSHTTASDALWCGAPVVTLTGDAFASRVAASLLNAVQLPELATSSVHEYEQRAVALASDRPRVAALREHLEKGRSSFPLFDSAATTRAIEAAYRHAAGLHRSGDAPRSFTLTPALEIV